MKETMHALVASHLEELGWDALREPAVARIFYRTAVGEKEVLSYLADWGPTENWVLSGQYYSEGSNVLSTASVSIPKDATVEQVRALATKFDANVNSAVNESYARRLWLRFGHDVSAQSNRSAQTIHAS